MGLSIKTRYLIPHHYYKKKQYGRHKITEIFNKIVRALSLSIHKGIKMCRLVSHIILFVIKAKTDNMQKVRDQHHNCL